LNTHDAGDIVTEKDHALAKEIDQINIWITWPPRFFWFQHLSVI
jgi:hypothetical protein